MGILYNGSTPASLIPYSDQSKIITYLTPKNFKGSSSTIWGNEYPVPMEKTGGYWELSSDGKYVYIHTTDTVSFDAHIHPFRALENFTLYIVGQYIGNRSGMTVKSGNTVPIKTARVFQDLPYTSQKEIGSSFSAWETGNDSHYNVDVSIFDTFHAYAVSHPLGSKPVHVLDNKSLEYFPVNGEVTAQIFSFAGSSGSETEGVYIKFLAIVNEAESSAVIQNNINCIRTQLNLT